MDKLDLKEDKIPMPVLVRGAHINEDFDESIIKPNLFQKIILKYKKKAIQIEEILQRQQKEKRQQEERQRQQEERQRQQEEERERQQEEERERQQEEEREKEKILKLKEFICFEKLINSFDEKNLNKTTCKILQEELDILPQIEKPEIINIEKSETINIKLIEDWIKLECLLEENNRITIEHIEKCEYCQSISSKCDNIKV